MLKFKLRDLTGNSYNREQFLKQLKQYEEEGYNIYIGSDSKVTLNNVILATVICFHKDGKTGRVFSSTTWHSVDNYKNLRSRMFLEAYSSLEWAMELEKYVSNKIEIHLDIGITKASKTSAFESELKSLILGQGYDCKLKPHSWCASAAADKIVNSIE